MAPKKAPQKSKKTTADVLPTAPPTTGAAAAQAAAPPDVPLLSVRYPCEPLSFHHHFGHEGGADLNIPFRYPSELPVFRDRSPDRVKILTEASAATLRAIITDASLETPDRKVLKKPTFLFGDSINMEDVEFYDGDYKWLREVHGRRLFLPNMERMFSISYFQQVSVPRLMNWEVARDQDGIIVGQLTPHGVHPTSYSCRLSILQPGSVRKDFPIGETPKPAGTFLRKFMLAKGEFPAHGFRAPGWVHSVDSGWWTRMVDFVMEELRGAVENSGLGIPILATRHGIVQNQSGFFSILELYNPDTCTFFTPAGELGFALHEMYEVSGLSFGELPYEEFIPGTGELTILRRTHPEIYDTYWEVMCHFHICAQVTGVRGGGVKQGSWADYLFQNLNDKYLSVERLSPSSDKEIISRIDEATARYMNEAMEDKFPAYTEFESFHHQARTPISDMALFAGFLMLWLKRCVVPTKPVDALAAEVAYPAVLLAYGRPLNLLSATVSCLQYGLRELVSEFVKVKETSKDGIRSFETPSPRVPLPYTYLVAWFTLHCPDLMTTPEATEGFVPLLQRLASARWAGWYHVFFRQLLSREFHYTVFRCFPHFEGGAYGAIHQDVKGGNSFTILNKGVFRWLLNIRPGYLVFRQGKRCFIEPYFPCRFARQFGYDQLYIGNPNPRLALVGNIAEGARAWYYSVAGCTGATFRLPYKVPNSYTSLGFCMWFHAASQIPEFRIYSSCLRDIRRMYGSKRNQRKQSRLRGLEEFLSSEQEAVEAGEVEPAVATIGEAQAREIRSKKAAGKRAMTAEETHQYETSAKRRLLLEPSSVPAEQGAKLMASAFQAAVPVATIPEETADESSVAGLSHQAGLRSTGPALMGEASYHSAGDEGSGDSEAGDAESAPVTSPVTQMPVEGQAGEEFERAARSQSPSALTMIPETVMPSPTTGLMARPALVESPGGSSEQLSYGTSIDEAWDDNPVPSPGKASAYIPASPSSKYSQLLSTLYAFRLYFKTFLLCGQDLQQEQHLLHLWLPVFPLGHQR